MITFTLTEFQALVLRKMVIEHLDQVIGDGSLSDEEDDALVEVNQMILEKTEGI